MTRHNLVDLSWKLIRLPFAKCEVYVSTLCVSRTCVCLVRAPVVEPAEREPGGGEPSPVGPDPDPDATEPHPAGADHGEQGPVSRRAETIHVTAPACHPLTPAINMSHMCFAGLHLHWTEKCVKSDFSC